MVSQDPHMNERHLKRIKVVLPLTLAAMLVGAVVGVLIPAIRPITQIAVPLAAVVGAAAIGVHAIKR